MAREDKIRLCIQYDDHPKVMSSVLCSMLEHQSLVDLAIRCGNNTMHAHKVILAANSPYFRAQLEANPGTEQVIINAMDYNDFKSLIEFIYCGETTILESHLKYIVAAAKLFQIRGLQALAVADEFYMPPPIFINEKAKYCSGFGPFVLGIPTEPLNSKLQDTTLSSFGSLENDENFLSSIGQPLETIDYSELNTSMIPTPMIMTPEEEIASDLSEKQPEDKAKEEYGNHPTEDAKEQYSADLQNNVDLMYKAQSEIYVQVSDDILRNISNEDHLEFPVYNRDNSDNKPKEDNKGSMEKFSEPFETFIPNEFPEDDNDNQDSVNIDAILLNMQTKKRTQGTFLDIKAATDEGDAGNANTQEVPLITQLDDPKNTEEAQKDTATPPKKDEGQPDINPDLSLINTTFYENIMYEAAHYFAEAGFAHQPDSTNDQIQVNENSNCNDSYNAKSIPDSPASPDQQFNNSEEEY